MQASVQLWLPAANVGEASASLREAALGQGSARASEEEAQEEEPAGTSISLPKQALRSRDQTEHVRTLLGQAVLKLLRPEAAATRSRQLDESEFGTITRNANAFGGDPPHRSWNFEENFVANEQILCCCSTAQAATAARSTTAEDLVAAGVEQDTQRWHSEVRRLGVALAGMTNFVRMGNVCLEETIRHVVATGWSQITWRRKYTALHLAAELGRDDVMLLLVALQADPAAKDSKDRMPVDIARTKERWSCVSLLRRLCQESSTRVGPSSVAPPAWHLPMPAFAESHAAKEPMVR
eukprot:CAMPEP_0179173610 /NCGR_PEP_ID=MMETSP0796-20121207/85677_1 /TAXON_ID=73915 /ORGANISM="Pyrodinium bahamense, Strain pbaha01" /LENGTH=294 /DNA_ID=CAMNT_0020876843 /DNA_START=1 /DNA_END=882 /DNA_ORIENTATION=+